MLDEGIAELRVKGVRRSKETAENAEAVVEGRGVAMMERRKRRIHRGKEELAGWVDWLNGGKGVLLDLVSEKSK
jgi:hypothetical protein